jgi:hypothetical protein
MQQRVGDGRLRSAAGAAASDRCQRLSHHRHDGLQLTDLLLQDVDVLSLSLPMQLRRQPVANLTPLLLLLLCGQSRKLGFRKIRACSTDTEVAKSKAGPADSGQVHHTTHQG